MKKNKLKVWKKFFNNEEMEQKDEKIVANK